jgi:phage shock protein E
LDPATLPDSVDVQTVYALKNDPEVFLLDVREPYEYEAGHIPGITLIPMGDVASRLGEIPTDKEVIITCRSGNRSAQIADFLRTQGFTNVHNMEGGILAWEAAGFEVEQ